MGAMIRAHDWSATSLGRPSTWPQSLRSTLSLCLGSPIVSALYWGPDFVLIYNDAYAPALAERHPHALGQPLREVWPDIWPVLQPQLERVVETGQGFATDRQRLLMKRLGRMEETYWFYSFAPVRGESGEVAGVFLNATELTAQVTSERRLRDLNDTLEQRIAERTQERDRLWRNTQDVQVVIDGQGVFMAVNPAFTVILGWTPEDVLGKPVFDFVEPDDEAVTDRALQHARAENLRTVENRYRHKAGGFRWISWVATPEADLIYASGRHITDEKEQAEALAQVEEALRQSQKMEAVGQLTGGLAHDFNNLLAGISGSLELMQVRMQQGRLTDVDRYMTAAQGAAKRAAALTHRLLAFSRRQTLDPKLTDVNRLATGMQEMIHCTVGPGSSQIEARHVGGITSENSLFLFSRAFPFSSALQDGREYYAKVVERVGLTVACAVARVGEDKPRFSAVGVAKVAERSIPFDRTERTRNQCAVQTSRLAADDRRAVLHPHVADNNRRTHNPAGVGRCRKLAK